VASLIVGGHAFASEKVDAIIIAYEKRIADGAAKLKSMAIADLIILKDQAMTAKDLKTAVAADTAMEKLTEELEASGYKVRPKEQAEKAVEPDLYPANELYKMIRTTNVNKQAWTENGVGFTCRFQRVPKLDVVNGGRPVLAMTCLDDPYAWTSDTVIIRDRKKKEIGRFQGLRRNQTVKVPLNIPFTDIMDIEIVNFGQNSVGFKLFSEKAPEIFIEME
jgi:hypothetical protein